jgi:polysaccharide export outer membrane protein
MRDRPARGRRAVWAAALGCALAAGCATEGSFVSVQDLPMTAESQAMIGPRDVLLVSVRNQPTLSGEFTVGDHGEYAQPTLGTISVAGKTTDEVVADLEGRLKDLLVKPEVTVSIIRTAAIRVSVVGEVKTPGSYELLRGRGLISALAAAGWLTEFANGDWIFAIRSDGGRVQRIRFKASELTAAEPHATGFRLRDGDVVVVE